MPCPPGAVPGPHGTFTNLTKGYTQCTDAQVQNEWKQVFWVSAGLCFFGAAFYLVTASGKVQPWNTPAVARERALEEQDDGVGGSGRVGSIQSAGRKGAV
eukprot:m.90351 g.90351  ORF g.90351 m.90351 type:complete len:100 (+) comp9855_c0_seq1:1646-1945(+)